jgi:signal transduction histidine kinase/ABC-type amino acid transport substrate-binding protein/ActR/RegA family two-component response regulator
MQPRQNYWRSFLVAGLILLLGLFAPFLFSAATAAERPTLRVGYVEEPCYAFKNAQGEYTGYTPELLYNIASQGNFNIEFVDFTNYDDEDRALLDGKIDVEVTVPESPERHQQFLLSESPTMKVPFTLLVREDENRFEFGDIQAVNKMRIGLIKNDAAAEIFQEWCRKNNLQPQLVYFPDYKLQIEALQKGKLDAMTNGNELAANFRRFLYYANVSCYAIFNKQRGDLKQLFDKGLRLSLVKNPLLEDDLYTKFVLEDSANLNLVAQSEKAFIAAHPHITVAIQAPNPPYIWSDDNGKLAGILPDYYAQLSRETGLQFTFQTYPTEGAALAAVRTGKAQVLGLFSGTLANAYKNKLRLIDFSNNQNLVRIDKVGALGMRVAVTAQNLPYLQSILSGKNYEFLSYPDNEACYQALRDGKADSIMCTDTSATWIFNNHRTDNCNMLPLTQVKKIYLAVPADADNVLFSILSNGARKLMPQYNSIVIANVAPKKDLRGLLGRLPFWGLAAFSGIMVVLVILLAVLFFLLARRYREKSLLAARKAENDKEKIRLDALEKNAEEKNQFFANISHDLRTPLNAILGFSFLARQTDEAAEQKNYLEKISGAGQLMLDLVNDTLTMSKLRSGKLEIKPEPLLEDPQILFAPVFDSVREMATAKNIQLVIDSSAAGSRRLLGDKLNLQKVLLNLLTNAVKYTPEGGHITVRFWNEKLPDGNIDSLFSVRDDGIGIAPEFQAHVFEPFSQERRPGYESTGTGLGLSIVKQLVTLMGGSITLQSVQDQGTTFTVRLSLPEAPAGAHLASDAAYQAEAAKQAAATFKQLAGHKVLLCEDNMLNREIACALLKSQRLVTVTANDGRQGVDIFNASKPGEFAAVLMDLRMPVLDGYEAAQEIRALPRPDAKTIPIIALTAETFAEDVQKCLDAGMNDHVAKPLVPEVLFGTLAKYVGP